MKKTIKLMGLLLTVILLSGCMKARSDITINSNGSIDYKYTVAISTKVQDMMKSYGSDEDSDSSSEALSEEDKKEAKEHGFEIEEYNQDGYKGYVLSKHFNNINDVSSEDEVTASTSLTKEDDVKLFTVKKGFFKNTYKAKVGYDSEKESNDSTKQYNSEEYKSYFEGMDISYNITLPTNAKSSNATSVDGKTLSWDLTKFDQDAIEYEFEMLNMTNIIIVVVACVAVIAIAVGVIVVLKKKKEVM